MNEPTFPFACQCGRSFQLKQRHLGTALLCPGCNSRLSVLANLPPADWDPAAARRAANEGAGSASSGPATSKSARPKSANDEKKWNIELPYLLGGIGLTLGGLIVGGIFVWCLQSAAGGRGMIYLALIAAVLLVMGPSMLLKGLFGKLIEWD